MLKSSTIGYASPEYMEKNSGDSGFQASEM